MTKISLIIISYKSNIAMLNQALDCSDLFDEVILHVNDKITAVQMKLPKKVNVIYREERMTPQEALNEAIGLATGDYILPFTDDDFFQRDNLKFVINFLKEQKEKVHIIHAPIFVGNEAGYVLWGKDPNITYEKMLQENSVPFSSIYNKEIWKDVKGYKDVVFSDWFFWLEVLKRGYSFYYLNNPLYYHRQEHKESLANRESKQYTMTEVQKLFKERLDNEQN